uniref:Uncharacterized protein n=1 Tax=Amphimedon queenslandica TaxID=400682 RepID=A0A1X7V3H3_AMPQE
MSLLVAPSNLYASSAGPLLLLLTHESLLVTR